MIQINRVSVGRVSGDNAAVVPSTPLLSRFANDPEMRDIVALFVSEVPERLREFRDAWGASDLRRVRTLAHQIKGAAGGYGYPEVSTAASELELAAGAADATTGSARTAFENFTAVLARVVIAG